MRTTNLFFFTGAILLLTSLGCEQDYLVVNNSDCFRIENTYGRDEELDTFSPRTEGLRGTAQGFVENKPWNIGVDLDRYQIDGQQLFYLRFISFWPCERPGVCAIAEDLRIFTIPFDERALGCHEITQHDIYTTDLRPYSAAYFIGFHDAPITQYQVDSLQENYLEITHIDTLTQTFEANMMASFVAEEGGRINERFPERIRLSNVAIKIWEFDD